VRLPTPGAELRVSVSPPAIPSRAPRSMSGIPRRKVSMKTRTRSRPR
jgi:hypothetical protein